MLNKAHRPSIIDADLLRHELERSNLRGMVDPVRLVIDLHNVTTYDKLLTLLGEKNPYGNFHLQTGDISTYHRILGNSHLDRTPGAAHLVVCGEAIAATIATIERASAEHRKHLHETLEEPEDQELARAA